MKKKTKIMLGVIGTICAASVISDNDENETAPERTIPTETTSVSEYYETETVTDTITKLIETTLSTQIIRTNASNITTVPKNEIQEITTTTTTGTSRKTAILPAATTSTVASKQTTTAPVTTKTVSTEIVRVPEPQPTEEKVSVTVYYTKSGSKYHYENPCGNGKYYPCSLEEAQMRGLQACEKCVYH